MGSIYRKVLIFLIMWKITGSTVGFGKRLFGDGASSVVILATIISAVPFQSGRPSYNIARQRHECKSLLFAGTSAVHILLLFFSGIYSPLMSWSWTEGCAVMDDGSSVIDRRVFPAL